MTEYGAALRLLWGLDPGFLTVNHGSFGATPIEVLDAQTEWRMRMEAQPSRFMRRELGPALRSAAAVLAEFVGAAPDDLVFVDNATSGCNAVLRSLSFAPGDEIVVFDHGYAAIANAAAFVARRSGAVVVTAPLPFPKPGGAAICESLRQALSPRTRLVIVDHITSPSAVVMPLAGLVEICRDAGVAILIDGAHGPGQLTLDLTGLGADYYTGNCHKWLMAPKGCAFLHVRSDRQAAMHPLTISHGYGQGFVAEFDWPGTMDFSAFLAVPQAIGFHKRLGGAALRARNVALAQQAVEMIAEGLRTESSAPGTPHPAMGLARLPVHDCARIDPLRDAIFDAGTDAPLHMLDNHIWVRISAHAYNEISDFAALIPILNLCCRRINSA